MDELAINPGELLRRARRIARLSQRELAARARIPVSTLARIEAGSTPNPRVQTLAALLAAADCRLAAMASGATEISQHPWEDARDFGDRHYPAHLDLLRVNEPYEPGEVDWYGWYRSWAWRRDAAIPVWTFRRLRTPYQCPRLDPATGRRIEGSGP